MSARTRRVRVTLDFVLQYDEAIDTVPPVDLVEVGEVFEIVARKLGLVSESEGADLLPEARCNIRLDFRKPQ